jgi:hypothetical protein
LIVPLIALSLSLFVLSFFLFSSVYFTSFKFGVSGFALTFSDPSLKASFGNNGIRRQIAWQWIGRYRSTSFSYFIPRARPMLSTIF